MKSQDENEKKFFETRVNDVINLYLQLNTQIFEGGINYSAPMESYKYLFDPIVELFSDKRFAEKINKENLDLLVEVVIINLV